MDREIRLRFARQPDMLILELPGAEIPQRRLQPSFVASLLNEAGKMLDDIVVGFGRHRVNCFYLERLHEAFGFGIIIPIAFASHGPHQSMIAEVATTAGDSFKYPDGKEFCGTIEVR
ncbi:hypothetical protein K9B32_08235 [Rhizobium sp. 3T7]|uniref:hypothetical protein n=1 Tax=Rhizobium sp. 3T7 TaxID=2874922 RepID=UPI001CCA4D3B|nr:hypothetical protein [Rhizobium sp. 3T7]MBZ9790117.1 hypothetical protein [Rhizobium sp. 3T7]